MKIKQLIDEWETFRRRSESVARIISELPPSSSDHIIKTNTSGLRINDNNFSQMWAGDSRISLDGQEGKLLIDTRYRAGIKAQVISLLCETLTIGNLALNNLHSQTSNNTLVSPAPNFDPGVPLIAGIPNTDQGQYSVYLGELLEPTSLMEDFTEVLDEDWSTYLLRKIKHNG